MLHSGRPCHPSRLKQSTYYHSLIMESPQIALNDDENQLLELGAKASGREVKVAVPFVRRSPRLQRKQVDPRVSHPSTQFPPVALPGSFTPRQSRPWSTVESQDGSNPPKRPKIVQSRPAAQHGAQGPSSSTNLLVTGNSAGVSGAGVTTTSVPAQVRYAVQQRVEWIKHLDSDFFPALVISTPWHEPDVGSSQVEPGDLNRTETSFGNVYSKVRKLIVIEVFDDHCLTIPIFSFNGKGLQYKKNKDDFVGVRDQLVKPVAPPESKHPNLIFARAKEFRRRYQGFHVMTATSNAHFTFPVSFRYDIPCCFEGRIIQDSHRQLLELYNSRPPVFRLDQKFGGPQGR